MLGLGRKPKKGTKAIPAGAFSFSPFLLTPDPHPLPEPKAFFSQGRHLSDAAYLEKEQRVYDWRLRERMKTVSVLLVMCLNIGGNTYKKFIIFFFFLKYLSILIYYIFT